MAATVQAWASRQRWATHQDAPEGEHELVALGGQLFKDPGGRQGGKDGHAHPEGAIAAQQHSRGRGRWAGGRAGTPRQLWLSGMAASASAGRGAAPRSPFSSRCPWEDSPAEGHGPERVSPLVLEQAGAELREPPKEEAKAVGQLRRALGLGELSLGALEERAGECEAKQAQGSCGEAAGAGTSARVVRRSKQSCQQAGASLAAGGGRRRRLVPASSRGTGGEPHCGRPSSSACWIRIKQFVCGRGPPRPGHRIVTLTWPTWWGFILPTYAVHESKHL